MSEATGTETIGVIDVAGQRLLCRLLRGYQEFARLLPPTTTSIGVQPFLSYTGIDGDALLRDHPTVIGCEKQRGPGNVFR